MFLPYGSTQLIYKENQLTGFYTMEKLVVKGSIFYSLTWNLFKIDPADFKKDIHS